MYSTITTNLNNFAQSVYPPAALGALVGVGIDTAMKTNTETKNTHAARTAVAFTAVNFLWNNVSEPLAFGAAAGLLCGRSLKAVLSSNQKPRNDLIYDIKAMALGAAVVAVTSVAIAISITP